MNAFESGLPTARCNIQRNHSHSQFWTGMAVDWFFTATEFYLYEFSPRN
jgi:hypothetical protein